MEPARQLPPWQVGLLLHTAAWEVPQGGVGSDMLTYGEMGTTILGTVPQIIAALLPPDCRVISENGRGLYPQSGRRIAKLPISPRLERERGVS